MFFDFCQGFLENIVLFFLFISTHSPHIGWDF